jgi:hypothetical protein
MTMLGQFSVTSNSSAHDVGPGALVIVEVIRMVGNITVEILGSLGAADFHDFHQIGKPDRAMPIDAMLDEGAAVALSPCHLMLVADIHARRIV